MQIQCLCVNVGNTMLLFISKKVQQSWEELCKEMRKMEKLEYKRQVLEYFTLCSLIFLSQS